MGDDLDKLWSEFSALNATVKAQWEWSQSFRAEANTALKDIQDKLDKMPCYSHGARMDSFERRLGTTLTLILLAFCAVGGTVTMIVMIHFKGG